eukprot:13131915-Alexandrium_andersonii.AAC.1
MALGRRRQAASTRQFMDLPAPELPRALVRRALVALQEPAAPGKMHASRGGCRETRDGAEEVAS